MSVDRYKAPWYPAITPALPNVASGAIQLKAIFGRQCPSNHSPYFRNTDNAVRPVALSAAMKMITIQLRDSVLPSCVRRRSDSQELRDPTVSPTRNACPLCKLLGLIDLPILLGSKADACAVRPAALVGASKCRGRGRVTPLQGLNGPINVRWGQLLAARRPTPNPQPGC
jgi:hypothetical protein